MMRLCLLLCVCLSLGSCGYGRPGTAEAVSVETKFNGQIEGEGLRVKTRQFEITVPPGYDAKINTAGAKQPAPPDQSATARTSSGAAQSDSGQAGEIAGDIAGLGGTLWIGIGLIIIGGLIFLAKRAGVASLIAPGPTGFIMRAAGVLPPGTGPCLIGLGGTIIVLPWLLDSVQPLVIPVAAAAVGILLAWWVYNIVQHESKENGQS